jgi:hypothetical protein
MKLLCEGCAIGWVCHFLNSLENILLISKMNLSLFLYVFYLWFSPKMVGQIHPWKLHLAPRGKIKNRPQFVHISSLTNAAPFDALLDRKSWNYFTLNESVNGWCSRVKRPAASHIEGNPIFETIIRLTFILKTLKKYFFVANAFISPFNTQTMHIKSCYTQQHCYGP